MRTEPANPVKPTIYVFVNGRYDNGDVEGMALSEDGEVLAGHLSSNDSFCQHDMGITSDWKHKHYAAHYPNGYALEWVEGDPTEHAGVQAAYERHLAKYAQAAAAPVTESVADS